MKLVLVSPVEGLCRVWGESFRSLPDVEIRRGRFENIASFDCMVSPANSFGLMDGGIDEAIIDYFGKSLMERVQNRIISYYLGEQQVGTSFVIETGNSNHKFLAHTPTMRVPMEIVGRDNVYKAMFAMLVAVHQHNAVSSDKIDIVACPGLGTGTGHVPYTEAARQMALAYKNYLNPPLRIDWSYADGRQHAIGCS